MQVAESRLLFWSVNSIPYIKQELRPWYDEFLTDMLQSDDGFSSTNAQKLAEHILAEELTNQDGCWDYILTRLFVLLGGLHSKINVGYIKFFIIITLGILTKPEKFFLFNRFVGVLLQVKLEYERRLGAKKAFLVKTFLDSLIWDFYMSTEGPYENKKIQENGDCY